MEKNGAILTSKLVSCPTMLCHNSNNSRWLDRSQVIFASIVAVLISLNSSPSEAIADEVILNKALPLSISTWVNSDDFSELYGPKDDYQIRYVELLGPLTLRVTAAYKGKRSNRDTDLLIDLKKVGQLSTEGRATRHVLAIPTDYLETGEGCAILWEEDEIFENLPEGSITTFNSYISRERYDVGEGCDILLAIADYVEEYRSNRKSVTYDTDDHSISLRSKGITKKFRLDLGTSLTLAHQGLGVVGKRYATSLDVEIASLEIENSFWGVFSLAPEGTANLLIGPEHTSSNRGFVPRSISLAPNGKPWIAYVGPQGENSLWGISVWHIGNTANQPKRLLEFAAGRVGYSEHRGFDHAVSWTGPNSIIYLEDDELTLTHVKISRSGTVKTLGSYSFERGMKYQVTNVLIDESWSQEFELFRLEALSAFPVKEGEVIRVACVAVLRYAHKGQTSQIAVPLVIDLSWNLGDIE